MSDPASISPMASAPEESVAELVDRITTLEPKLHAWAHFDEEGALERARRVAGQVRQGPLHGLPVGIKDIFDTADMPTEYGSPIYAGHQPDHDAAVVTQLREAGAVLMGKTVTTEFATWTPAATRNPLAPERTPGGSSSGSAAAVAAGMVPVALGTQTVGSTIRPASFCGIVGFKPTKGLVDLTGAKPQSPSQDTIGVLGRSVADVSRIASAIGISVPDRLKGSLNPRLAFCRTPWWERMEPDGAGAIEKAASLAQGNGCEVTEAELPAEFDELLDTQMAITEYEVARSLEAEYRTHREQISPVLTSLIERGLTISEKELKSALAIGQSCRDAIKPLWESVDAVLTPAVPGQAPRGLDSTGDPTFARAWSLIGGPAISIPGMTGDDSLPIGTQLLAAPGEDAALLAVSARLEEILGD